MGVLNRESFSDQCSVVTVNVIQVVGKVTLSVIGAGKAEVLS